MGQLLSLAAQALHAMKCPHGIRTTSRVASRQTAHSSRGRGSRVPPATCIPSPCGRSWGGGGSWMGVACTGMFAGGGRGVCGRGWGRGGAGAEVETSGARYPVAGIWVGALMINGCDSWPIYWDILAADAGMEVVDAVAGIALDCVVTFVALPTEVAGADSATSKLRWCCGRLNSCSPIAFLIVVSGAISIKFTFAALFPVTAVMSRCPARRSSMKSSFICAHKITKSRGSSMCFTFICASYSHTHSTSSCALGKSCPRKFGHRK